MLTLLREITPDIEDQILELKDFTREQYDTLIALGGKPTRPIRMEPVWKASNEKGLLYIMDAELKHKISLPEEDLIIFHWGQECSKFEEELQQWREFRNYQTSDKHPLLLDTPLTSDVASPRLTAVLKRLNDWREYENWQWQKVNNTTKLKDRCRRALEGLREQGLASNDPEEKHAAQMSPLGNWLFNIERRGEEMTTQRKHLAWIRSQYHEILKEIHASLLASPSLLQELESSMQTQVDILRQDLQQLGFTCNPPVCCLDPHPCYRKRSLDLNAKTSQLLEQKQDFQTYVEWRQKGSKHESADCLWEGKPNFDLLKEYMDHRQSIMDNQTEQVESWQRIVEWREYIIRVRGGVQPDASDFRLCYLNHAREYVCVSQEDAEVAKSKLQRAQQMLAGVTAQHSEDRQLSEDVSSAPSSAIHSGRDAMTASPPSSVTSRSSQQLAAYANRKRKAEALGPISDSEIQKAAKRPRRTPKSFTESQTGVLLAAATPPAPQLSVHQDDIDMQDSSSAPVISALQDDTDAEAFEEITESTKKRQNPLRNARSKPDKSPRMDQDTNNSSKITKSGTKKPVIDTKKLAKLHATSLLSAASAAQADSGKAQIPTGTQNTQCQVAVAVVIPTQTPPPMAPLSAKPPLRRSERQKGKAAVSPPNNALEPKLGGTKRKQPRTKNPKDPKAAATQRTGRS